MTSTKHIAHKQPAARFAEHTEAGPLAYVGESVGVLTHTHTQMFCRSEKKKKKALPDLQTCRLLLECRPNVCAKRLLGATVNPFMCCGGLKPPPPHYLPKADMTRGAIGQQAPSLSGLNDCFEERN